MGKLSVLSGREVCNILAQHGFEQVRQPYYHAKRADGTTITAPVPDHAELSMGMLQSIISQSGLPAPRLRKNKVPSSGG